MQLIKKACLLSLALCVSVTMLFGQGAVGTILGTVTDASGGVMPGADITITNVETGVAQLTKSTSEGSYSVPFLKPGLYQVTVESAGFAASTFDNIRLAVDQRIRIDAELRPGTVAETIDVTGTALALDTDSASVSQSVTARQVSDLPLNGRNFTQLMLLSPGTVQTGGEQGTRPGSGGAISMMGARPSSNLYLIDGVANNDVIYQTAAIRPSIDAIQEFKMQTMTYSSEYGSSANQINISIKSGTNELHGTLFHFLRNDAVDARGPFDGSTIPPLRQNQFGYTLGGPVYIPKVYDGRNRTFFFANYEGWRTRQSSTSFGTVATTDEISGRFGETITDPVSGVVFPNGTIPQSRMSRVGGVLAAVSPAPNTNIPQGNFTFVVPTPTDQNQQIYRFDQSFGTSDFVFGRYSVSDFGSQEQGGLTQIANRVNVLENVSWQVNYTRTFSPTIVNQFRFGYLAALADRVGQPAPSGTVASLGLTGTYPNLEELGMSFPTAGFSTARGLSGIGGSGNVPWLNRQPTYDIWNSTSINRGAHTFSFGANVRWWRLENNVSTGYLGQWTFNGDFSGHPTADMLLGNPFEVWTTQPTAFSDPVNPGNPVNIHYNLIAPYFQDDWKVTSNLTINIGLRYDYSSLPYEENNKWGWIDPNIPGGGIAVADKELIDAGIGGQFYSYGGGRTAGESQKRLLSQKCEAGRRALNGSACESWEAGQHPGWAILRCVNHGNNEGGSKRGAVTNFYQKTTAIESPYGCRHRGKRHRDDRANRTARFQEAALQPLRAELPAGAQPRGEATFVARPAVAEGAACAALPASAGQVRALRSAHGSVALGRAVGAGERRTGRIGGGPDEASELARSRPSFRPELEKRGGHRPTRGRLWAGATAAQAAALDWRRRGQPPQGASLPHGGLRSGAAYAGVGWRRPQRTDTAEVFLRAGP